MSTQTELFEFPSTTLSPDAQLKKDIQEWNRVALEWGPLVSASVAARAVRISTTRVQELITGGKIQVWSFFGKQYVSLPEVQFHVKTAHKRKGGRPENCNGGRPRLASPFQVS